MSWIDVTEAGVQVLDLRRPPLDVNVPDVDAMLALKHCAPACRDDNGDRVVDHRIQPQMVRARTVLLNCARIVASSSWS